MTEQSNAVELAAELAVAWLTNPNTRTTTEDVPEFLRTVHDAVCKLTTPDLVQEQQASEPEQFAPAVSVRKSLSSPEHIISLIDGKPYRTLRRHLSTNGLTPDEYRQRYGLKADYPMVAPTYSEHRRTMAKKLGLGRKKAQGEDLPGEAPAD